MTTYSFFEKKVVSLTLVSTLLFIGSELVVELGVSVRKRCSPIYVEGPIIKWNYTNDPPVVETAPFAFLLNQITFLDGDFEYIAEGFPKNINDTLCISCLKNDFPRHNNSTRVIIADCDVTEHRNYSLGQLDVGIKLTSNPFGTVTVGFAEKNQDGNHSRCYCGNGDLTKNHNRTFSTILFHNVPVGEDHDEDEEIVADNNNSTCNCDEPNFFENKFQESNTTGHVLYFEYNNQTHIDRLFAMAQGNKSRPHVIWESTQGVTYVQKISCDTIAMNVESLNRALLVLRSIQVENGLNPAPFNYTTDRFDIFKKKDIYNAVLSVKAAEDTQNAEDDEEKNNKNNMGSYQIYKECGVFDTKYAIPTILSAVAILILGAISAARLKQSRGHENAQQLALTNFQGNGPGDVSSGIPLFSIGAAQQAEDLNEPSRSRRRPWAAEPEILQIEVDNEENVSTLRVLPPGHIQAEDNF